MTGVNVLEKMGTRLKLKEVTAKGEWRALVFRVADGKELTGAEIDHLDDLGAVLNLDDVPGRFTADVELVRSVAERERLHPDYEAETKEVQRQAQEARQKCDEARAEVIRQNAIAIAKGHEANAIAADGAKLDQDKRSRPDLFADFEPVKKKK